jgi:hypothetical protein
LVSVPSRPEDFQMRAMSVSATPHARVGSIARLGR